MSTLLTSKTCEVNESYCKFGSEALLNLVESFEDNVDGVIQNEDVEFVHKTRVVSRRLRAALPLFRSCFPRKKYKKWLKEIKNVTCLLGEARDLDVQIAFIEQYMKKWGTFENTSMGILLSDHKNRRNTIQSTVASGLEQLKAAGTLDNIHKFCEQTIAQQSNLAFDPGQVTEKAYWQISFRLDDFLSMQKYVYKEKEKLKHHQMRIYAKKLRYTMETFAPVYKKQLGKEIQNIKAYQDILGEMHDYDVWIQYIPKFIAKTKLAASKTKKTDNKKTEKAMLKFSAYIKQKRKQNYCKFVNLWEQNQKNASFDKLRRAIQAGLTNPKVKIHQFLTNPNVTIGVLSDIHANLQALEKVFEDAERRGVNVFLNAGDSIGFGPYPNEVVELLCQKNVLSVVGNYDLEVIEGKAKAAGEKKTALKIARKELAKTCECYLKSLPRELRLKVWGKKLFVTHGSPESIEEHIYPDTSVERLKTLSDTAKADVIIVGHSHEQFLKEANGIYFVNPGSVGRPGDGNPEAAYAVLSFNPFKVNLIRLDYEVEAAADALRKKALPESFAQMLLKGVSIDAVIEDDKAKKDFMVQKCSEAVEASKKFSKKYWPDTVHCESVTKLALELFDGLIELHNLGSHERCWLECASILHDVGLSSNNGAHHKVSAKLILNDTKLPFTSQERKVIASIARYHRKGLPKQNHYNLATLDRETCRKISILASLLRVADGLDYTHGSIVENLSLKLGPKRIIVECVSKKKSMPEEQAFNKKKDLFEKVFAKKMVLIWKLPE